MLVGIRIQTILQAVPTGQKIAFPHKSLSQYRSTRKSSENVGEEEISHLRSSRPLTHHNNQPLSDLFGPGSVDDGIHHWGNNNLQVGQQYVNLWWDFPLARSISDEGEEGWDVVEGEDTYV